MKLQDKLKIRNLKIAEKTSDDRPITLIQTEDKVVQRCCNDVVFLPRWGILDILVGIP